MNYIKTYYELIKSKKIIVSKKVKRQIELLINDIENPNQYHFDIKRAPAAYFALGALFLVFMYPKRNYPFFISSRIALRRSSVVGFSRR